MPRTLSPFLILTVSLFYSCNKQTDTAASATKNILAQVGDKIITVNDFIKRCEYVPRPVYCKGDNYIHKKIALNSLVAEKLLAIEFEKLNYTITESQKFLIQGQKEQAMRQLMLKRFGYDKVKIDTNHIVKLSKLSKREYQMRFISLNKKYKQKIEGFSGNQKLNDLVLMLDKNIEIYNKTVNIDENMIKEVEEILFYGNQNVNTLYGPFYAGINNILYFEIQGWTNHADITDKQKQDTWDQVKHKYMEKMAGKFYSKYVAELMKKKTIEYDPEIFELFSIKLGKIYLIEKNRKEAAIENRIWERKKETEAASFEDIRKMKNSVILTYDNKQYNVLELLDLIKKHPLVFRNKTITPEMFTNELKYAVADLFRDTHITEKAYTLNLDNDIRVKNIEKKWDDYIKSSSIKKIFGDDLVSNIKPTTRLIERVDSLQNLYSDIIKIDTDKFEIINLSKVDMNVIYSNQPYAKLEPDFPIITDDHILNYGKKVSFND